MKQRHPAQDRDETHECDLVLDEQLLGPDVSADDSEHDDDAGEDAAPPAHEQRRLVIVEGARRRRRRVEGHGARPPPQRDRRRGNDDSSSRAGLVRGRDLVDYDVCSWRSGVCHLAFAGGRGRGCGLGTQYSVLARQNVIAVEQVECQWSP